MMISLKDILNKRNSTRALSDEQFDECLPRLAKELESLDFRHRYEEDELRKDWDSLVSWRSDGTTINSTSRKGMKLCEHFCPNFFDIRNPKGVNFSGLWKASNLEKILRWNRRGHSTPYLSELRRGIYFCCGLTKNTMYRPQMMKLACLRHQPRTVLDPCAGWGGRMLGAVSFGSRYIGFEPSTQTYENLLRMVDFLGIGDRVTLIHDDCRTMTNRDLPRVDMILTSPPYFDLEVYSDEDTQSISSHDSYESWSNGFLREVIRSGIHLLTDGGVSCWNVGRVRNHDMQEDVEKHHSEMGFRPIETLKVSSSKRQSNQSAARNEKNDDNTVVYRRVME